MIRVEQKHYRRKADRHANAPELQSFYLACMLEGQAGVLKHLLDRIPKTVTRDHFLNKLQFFTLIVHSPI